MQGHQAPWFLSHRQSPWCAALSWRNSYGKQAILSPALTKSLKMDMLSRAKQKIYIYMSRFGFTCFPSNSTTAEKKERWKKLECLTTFISHMMGVITDKCLILTKGNRKHSTRTKNLSYNQCTYIVISHAACSSLFNSVGRYEWINPVFWQIGLYKKGTGVIEVLYTYCSCCNWWNSTFWVTCFSNSGKQEI